MIPFINETSAETLLRQSLMETRAGQYSNFLQKLEEAMRMKWELVTHSPHTRPSANAVEFATLREVARALANTPTSLARRARPIAWRFVRKATLSVSRDNNDFVHHSCLFACWNQLSKTLRNGSENKKLFFEVEKHFRAYRAGLLRLKRRYREQIPVQEVDMFGTQQLKRLGAILIKVK